MRIIILAWLLTLLGTTCSAQGLSDFNGLTENLSKRTYNQKAYDLGDKKTRYRIHTRQLHYKDNRGDFKDIDTSLKFNIFTRKWTHKKASYHPVIPEYADGWFEFYNAYKGANHTIKARPIAQHVKGVYYGNQSDGNYVLYKGAFGAGIDLKVYSYWAGLKKVIVINNKPADVSKDLTFDFEMAMPSRIVDKAGVAWNKQAGLNFKNKTLKIGTKNKESYFRNAYVWDSKDLNESVDIELYSKNGKTYLRKTIKAATLQAATYPLYTDHPTSYYAGVGDGQCFGHGGQSWTLQIAWDNCHDSITGSSYAAMSTSYTAVTARVGCLSAPPATKSQFEIPRAFIPIDTSGIADGDTISTAILKIYVTVVQNDDNDGQDYINVVQTSQADTSQLTDTDFDQCGAINNPTVGASSIDLGSLSTSAYNSFTLNDTGKGWIDKTGITKLGIREGHDIEDTPVAETGNEDDGNLVTFSTSEETGTGQDPYLDVTTSSGATFTPKIIFF